MAKFFGLLTACLFLLTGSSVLGQAASCNVVLVRPKATIVEPYVGDCSDGLAQGSGRYAGRSEPVQSGGQGVSSTFSVVGQFYKGMLNGKAKLLTQYSSGDTTTFEGDYVNNRASGQGRQLALMGSGADPYNSIEEGEWRNDQLWAGRGLLFMRSENVYVGYAVVNGKQGAVCRTDHLGDPGCSPQMRAQLLSEVQLTTAKELMAQALAPALATPATAAAQVSPPQPTAGAARVVSLGVGAANYYGYQYFLGDSRSAPGVTIWAFVEYQRDGDNGPIHPPEKTIPCNFRNGHLLGIVPPGVDLTDDQLARSIVYEVESLYRQHCKIEGYKLSVILAPENYEPAIGTRKTILPRLVEADPVNCQSGACSISDGFYRNYQKEAAMASVARREGELRRNEFFKTFGVVELADQKSLRSNPFALEGKVVAFVAQFHQMLTSNTALVGDAVFTEVPKTTFARPQEVLIAGKVIGNTEVKLPVVGPTLLPSLKFSGVYTCQQNKCRELFLN